MDEICQKVSKGEPFSSADALALIAYQHGHYHFGNRIGLVLIVRICTLQELPEDVRRRYIDQFARTAPHPNQIWPSTYNTLLKNVQRLATFGQFQTVIADIYAGGHTIEPPTPEPLISYNSPELFPGYDLYWSEVARAVANITGCRPIIYLFNKNVTYALLTVRHYIYHLLARTPATGSVFRNAKNIDKLISDTMPFETLVDNIDAIIKKNGLKVVENVDPVNTCVHMAMCRIIELSTA